MFQRLITVIGDADLVYLVCEIRLICLSHPSPSLWLRDLTPSTLEMAGDLIFLFWF
ncbi:uncharacterized protein ASCRUDRAFT_131531 [Ascoidea rubescens DSM 1968]|uniref:Uncharacterized protein n=1 Tax=Ascoidea rubescens DSM 1968 TaxID=1344418 RepID=A0A1D2V8C1_9ASCO|nr:hypothetical protein ASCRUDRAFT_131531 [Ascoidea rubescens DSM 1968]ODV57899.1 hypothetical protein ASCRUDRAFT_131531 [Ascoidea rubescens DSM 1968]